MTEIKENECRICYEDKSNFWSCTQCVYKICLNCEKRLNKCPFCRLIIKKTLSLPLSFFFSRDVELVLPTAAISLGDIRINFIDGSFVHEQLRWISNESSE